MTERQCRLGAAMINDVLGITMYEEDVMGWHWRRS